MNEYMSPSVQGFACSSLSKLILKESSETLLAQL